MPPAGPRSHFPLTGPPVIIRAVRDSRKCARPRNTGRNTSRQSSRSRETPRTRVRFLFPAGRRGPPARPPGPARGAHGGRAAGPVAAHAPGDRGPRTRRETQIAAASEPEINGHYQPGMTEVSGDRCVSGRAARPPILGGGMQSHMGYHGDCGRRVATALPRNCKKQFRTARKSGRRHARADGRANRAAHPAGHPAAAAAGKPRHHRAGGGAGDPRFGVQDQPDRTRPERHPRDRRSRPADLLRRRGGRAGAAAEPGRAG